MGLVWLILIVALSPLALIIAAVVLLLTGDAAKKSRGKKLLLAGILGLLIEILIGFSVCSNLHFQ
jgi:hypothetical protein